MLVNLSQIIVTMSFLKLKSKQKSGHGMVLDSEWRVKSPCMTELADIARHSARWRGMNQHFNKKKAFACA